MIWAILKNLKYRGGRLGPRRGRRPEAVEAGPALSGPRPKPHPGPLEAEDGGVERPGGMPAESHKAPLHLQVVSPPAVFLDCCGYPCWRR
jgi:hypothetical protein